MGKAEGRVQIELTDAGKVILRGIIFIAFATVMIPAFDVLSVLICVMLVALVVGYRSSAEDSRHREPARAH